MKLAHLAALMLVSTALVAAPRAFADDRTVTIAIDFSLTGADADGAARMKDGALLAIEQANATGGAGGYKLLPLLLDDGTPAAGQYDPAQAATNARKMASDPTVVAAVGPQMSGAAKAMTPVLNEANLAMITPSAVNSDLTSIRFADLYRESGKVTFFRTVATDTYQAFLANYFAETLHVKSVYVLDDTGAYGVGLANAFTAQAARKGMKVLGRDRVDPKAQDYSSVLTKIRAVNPDALYFGGVFAAGLKIVKQSYDIIPKMIKGGGDGLYGPEFLTASGFPAAEGWYMTVGSPHLIGDTGTQGFIKAFKARFAMPPDDYSMTSYDAATIIIGAIKGLAASGKPVTRDTVREAIEKSKTPTLQGLIEFDANGDLKTKVISIYQVKQDATQPLDDMDAQFRYLGTAQPN